MPTWSPGESLEYYAPIGADERVRERLSQGLFWSDSASMEITGICNLRCEVCPQGQTNGYHDSKRGGRRVDFETIVGWQRSLAQLGVRWLSYNVFNEPFLHPEFQKILAYGRAMGLTPIISTNIARLEPWVYDFKPIIIGTFYLGGSKQALHHGYTEAVEARLAQLKEYVASREGVEEHPYLHSEVRTLYGTQDGLEWGLLRPWAGAYLQEAIDSTFASFTDEQFLEWPDWFVRPNETLAYSCSLHGLLEIVILAEGYLQLCCADPVGGTRYAQVTAENLVEMVQQQGFATWLEAKSPRLSTACSMCLRADLQYTCQLQAHIDHLRSNETDNGQP